MLVGSIYGSLSWIWVLMLCWAPSLHADYIYQGSKYNPPTINGTNDTCSYPVPATSLSSCPQNADSRTGYPIVYVNDKANAPPTVAATASLVQFQGIDQALLTFSARMIIQMTWNDSRGYQHIRNSTDAANKSGRCGRYCSKSTLSGGGGDCCDGIWLPSLQFLGAQAASFREENYIITAQGPEYKAAAGNTVSYLLKASVTVDQAFDFSAFPFDKHALRTTIICDDCHLKKDTTGGPSAFFASYDYTSSEGSGSLLDGQAIPPSSGWQLNTVDLALVNITTDKETVTPTGKTSIAVTGTKPALSGMILILKVERVTRLYYALQVIMPAVILVLIGFGVFFVAQDQFGQRFGMLVALLFPTFITQFTVSQLIPKTFTILSPQLLAFVSLLELALLVSINCITHVILSRKTNVAWKLGMQKDLEQSKDQQEWLLRGEGDRQAEKDGMEEVPELKNKTSGFTFPSKAEEEAAAEEEKKRAHDEGVRQIALRTQKRGPLWLKRFRLWYTSLAMYDAGGRRDRAAFLFERWALSLAFIAYVGMVLGIFLPLDVQGNREGTL